MTLEKIFAGIGLAITYWVVPFVLWFCLGMGDRTDRSKKIYASIVFVLGIACLVAMISCLNSSYLTDRDFAFVWALTGLLCFLQSGFIFLQNPYKKYRRKN